MMFVRSEAGSAVRRAAFMTVAWLGCLNGNGAVAQIDAPKPASAATVERWRQASVGEPREDGRDADFADRGFVATRSDPVIRSVTGKPVWDLGAYDFVTGPAPASVHPGLWRQMALLRRNGLFKVADGVWQVRGFDVSNLTVVQGRTGWVLIDPLNVRETAAAALDLVNRALGARPVTAVIYTHSHADHFGGVRGVVDETEVRAGRVPILAPERFREESASENVMAGPATGRRGAFQFGMGIKPGVLGHVGSGLSAGIAAGETTLIPPTDTIVRTGETRSIDGVALEFQIVSGSEAPSELNVYLPDRRVLLSAEMSTCSLHNLLTPRGAKVRDARIWSNYIDEALRLYGDRSDVLIASHCWPRFGNAEVKETLGGQRDNYRYIHDQSLRLINDGASLSEVAEHLAQPSALAAARYNRGYYGTYKHDAKAVYQYYLGWYDAVPANLDPLPPVARGKRMVAAMGGADHVLSEARRAMTEGDYRWSSDILSNLVFADHGNVAARTLLADSYEQQGYQAESGIWRNQFLQAAWELRHGPASSGLSQNEDMRAAVATPLLFEAIATRFDPARFVGPPLGFSVIVSDRSEQMAVELTGIVMRSRPGGIRTPSAEIVATRLQLQQLFYAKVPLADLERAGLKVAGNRQAVQAWLDAIVPPKRDFAIVTP